MNDYQMSILANDHRQALLAEARRERLARTSRVPVARRRQPRSSSRPAGLGLLMGRVSLF